MSEGRKAGESHSLFRRREQGEGWYHVTPKGTRPGDPDAAVNLYCMPTMSFKGPPGKRKIIRGDDFVERERGGSLQEEAKARPSRAPTLESNCLWWLNLTAALVVVGLVAAMLTVETSLHRGLFRTIAFTFTILAVLSFRKYGQWRVIMARNAGVAIPHKNNELASLLWIEELNVEILSLLCLVPCPLPLWSTGDHESNSEAWLILVILVLRTLFLLRCCILNDPLNSDARKFSRTNCGLRKYRIVLISRFRKDPRWLLSLWMTCLFACSYLLHAAEKPYGSYFSDFFNSLVYILGVFTKAGVAPQLPVTRLGGSILMFSCFMSIVLLCITFNFLVCLVDVDDALLRVERAHHENRMKLLQRLQAVRCIEMFYVASPMYARLRDKVGQRIKKESDRRAVQGFQLQGEMRRSRDLRNYLKRFRWIESDDEMFALTTMSAGIEKMKVKLDQVQDVVTSLELDVRARR